MMMDRLPNTTYLYKGDNGLFRYYESFRELEDETPLIEQGKTETFDDFLERILEALKNEIKLSKQYNLKP